MIRAPQDLVLCCMPFLDSIQIRYGIKIIPDMEIVCLIILHGDVSLKERVDQLDHDMVPWGHSRKIIENF